jgi:cystathionine beta-lyase/cystathionine gamma-synthase
MNDKPSHISTQCAHAGGEHVVSSSTPGVMPIYQTSVFEFEDLETLDAAYEGKKSGFIYGRFGLPNHSALEQIVAKLENGQDAIVNGSGMASIVVALWTVLQSGDEVLVANDSYGGTLAVAARDLPRFGIAARFVAATSVESVEAAFTPKTKALLVETLSNPLWSVVDIAALAQVCRARGVKLLVDNTVATPYLIQPLTLGADVVMHSATKFLGGHHDLTAGILVADRTFIDSAREAATRVGAFLAPFDAWLAVRGIKTFPLRMERSCANALAVAQCLQNHYDVRQVFYPGLETHPQHEIVRRDMRGLGGGMVSFELTGDITAVEKFIRKLQLIRFTPSLGGVTTTISHPAKTSHRSLAPAQRADIGISDSLLRVSVGIEETNDILSDLEEALD